MKRLVRRAAFLVFVVCLLVLRVNPVPPGHRATILQFACTRGYYPIVAVQLALGVSPDGPERPPLIEAICCNHTGVARLLVAYGADIERDFQSGEPGGTPLQWALRCGRVDIAKMLLRNGAHTDYGLLDMAIELGDADIVDLMLKNDTDPNHADYRGASPLHWAAAYGRIEIASILLRAGARMDAKTVQVAHRECRCWRGRKKLDGALFSIPAHSTPLDLAVARKDEAMIKLLSSR